MIGISIFEQVLQTSSTLHLLCFSYLVTQSLCKMTIKFVSYNLSTLNLEIVNPKPIPHAYIPTFVFSIVLY